MNETFDFQNITDPGATVSQTVAGVTLTVSASGTGIATWDADIGGDGPTYFGESGDSIYTDATANSVTFSFDAPVDIISIFVVDADNDSVDWVFTPTGGSNSVVNQSGVADLNSTSTGTLVNLNWTGVTSFTVTEAGGSTFVPSFDTLVFTPSNVAPALGGTFTTAGTVDDNATTTPFSGVTYSDADGTSYTVAITYTAANGTLSGTGLSGSAGNYTLTGSNAADVQSKLQALVFTPTANQVAPGNTVQTTFTLTPNDGITNGTANSTTVITATSINDAPVLADTVLSLSAVNEDAGVPSGGVGTLVSSLVGGITDADSGAVKGIALTATDGANGTWYYSTDGGTNWTVVGAVSGSAALLLASDANTRIYFAPNVDYNGTVTNGITFRAWDQTTGSNGGTADTTTNGGTTAFSSATDTASVTVNAVNDAPTLSGGPYNFTATNEDTPTTGVLVSAIIGGTSYADVDSGASQGIAVNALTGNGTWQYSTNSTNGADGTWTAFGTVTNTSALLLASSTWVRYVPDGLNGETATLTFHGWDQTSGSVGSKVDVSTNGGTTAFSTGTAQGSLTVSSVNDDPSVTGLPTDITVTEDIASNVDLSAVTLSDPDSGSGNITLTIAAGAGTLAASSGGSVTVSGSGTGTLTLTGTVANIDTYLNTASNIQYTGAANAAGNDVTTLTLTANDGGNTGAGGGGDVSLGTVNIDITDTPDITSASYDYNSNQLVVSGNGFTAGGGAGDDIDVTKLTFTGEGGATYTLASSSNVDIDSATQFTVTLSGADLYNVESLLNKDGTSSATSGTTYNLAATDDFNTHVTAGDTSGNAGITVSNYAAPAITSATYDASTGQLIITGTNFVSQSGAGNDLDASLLTITGDWGSYTLTDTADVDITSATTATLTLSATDQLNVNGLLNKNGTTSGGVVTYNLAAADNWLTGAPASNDISDSAGNGITVSNVQTPTIISAVYDAPNHNLFVTGTNFFKKPGANNDIDVSLLTMVGGNNATYTLITTSDVEITSATSFTIHISNGDDSTLYGIFNQLGTTSSFGTTYDIQAADGWLTAADPAVDISDNTAEGGVNVTINPQISTSTYNATTGVLVVTGSNFEATAGAANDIIANKFTFTGEGGETYTLTDSADVELDNINQFTVTLSATDKAAVNQLINKNGTSSVGGTTYNLSAADDWCACPSSAAADISDTTNAITVSSVPVPTITSATYNASTGVLAVTGTNYLSASGAANDIIADKFTFTGEGGETYTLTDTADVDITSGTAFTLTLSAADMAAVNQIINKDGTVSTGGTTYNLAAAEDWAAGADAAATVADLTGNGITVSNVAVPTITSATYHTGTGVLTVTGTGFLKLSGAANDIDLSKFTFTGKGGTTYTLTTATDVEITSATEFTATLSGADKTGVNALLNANGAAASDSTPYNLDAGEDWAAGADAAVNVADAAGNPITVTLFVPPPPPSPAPSPAPEPENTFDGVEIQSETQSDGTQTLTVPVVEESREDDPSTPLSTHADIPVATGEEGETLLTVSVPAGVGLTVEGKTQSLSGDIAAAELIRRIEQKTDEGSESRQVLTQNGQQFFDSLAAADTLIIKTIVPTVADPNSAPQLPIIISGADPSGTDGNVKTALVIDVRNLPKGTVLQIDNIDFVTLIGEVIAIGGAGQNIASGDDQTQFIVLGADDDILTGGGGDDTVGSLGGDDQTFGDNGNDTVYGGAGQDRLSGGAGSDALNGGFGFDIALQTGSADDYSFAVQGGSVILTRNGNGETDTLTDVERVQFDTGASLAIAHSEREAVAHHLVTTWLGRDLSIDEATAVQNWEGASREDLVDVFKNLLAPDEIKDKSSAELLAGLDENANIIRLDAQRDFVAGDGDDQGYLPLGLALNVDGGQGHDVLRMGGSRAEVHLEAKEGKLELTRYQDGAMLNLDNAEMIAFDNSDTVVLAHDAIEGILGRLVQTFLDRDASVEEWQLGREVLTAHVDYNDILNWFQDQAGLKQLNDSDYIQTLYQNTLQRQAGDDELNAYLTKLEDGALDRNWLAVDIASSEEAITAVGSVMTFEGWV